MNLRANGVGFAEKREQQRFRAEIADWEKQSRLFNLPDYLAKEGIDHDRALRQHAPKLEYAADGDQQRRADEGKKGAKDYRDKKVHVAPLNFKNGLRGFFAQRN